MPIGRPPDLSEKRTARLEVRLHPTEHAAIEAASLAAGLSAAEWLRAAALTATGRYDLVEQLRRIEPALIERADRIRRDGLGGIRAGKTPSFMFHPEGRRGAPLDECTSRAIQYRSALVLHVVPMRLVTSPQLPWPPRARMPEPPADGTPLERTSPYHPSTIADWRHEVALRLLSTAHAAGRRHVWMYEHGSALLCTSMDYGFDDRAKEAPIAYGVLHRSGTIEVVIEVDGGRDLVHAVADVQRHLTEHLGLLPELGAERPYAIALSAFGIAGAVLPGARPGATRGEGYVKGRIDEDEVLLPIVEIDGTPGAHPLQQPLDALWQLAGLARCHALDR